MRGLGFSDNSGMLSSLVHAFGLGINRTVRMIINWQGDKIHSTKKRVPAPNADLGQRRNRYPYISSGNKKLKPLNLP